MRSSKALLLSTLLATLLTDGVKAAAFLPKSDEEIVDKLPENIWKKSKPKSLGFQKKSAPETLTAALELARSNIEIGKAESDPRFLSRTDALLSKWCEGPAPSVDALILRAYARQSLHAFDRALVDLNLALSSRPIEAQAWLLKSAIFQVKGNYSGARAASFQLLRLGKSFEGMISAASIASLTGNAMKACEMLTSAVSLGQTPEQKQWVLTTLAETEARLGNALNAEMHFNEARNIPRRDPYLAGAFADFLLDQNRNGEVIALLREETQIDGFLLRLAIAEKGAQAPEFKVHVADLQSRFTRLRARHDKGHLREEARFELEVLDNPIAALPFALENWDIQREPVDAWLVIASAVQNYEAGRPVIDWVKETKLEDLKIRHVIETMLQPARAGL